MQTTRNIFPCSQTVCLAPNRRVKIHSSKLPSDFFKNKPKSICKFQSSRISTKQQELPPTPVFPQIKAEMTYRAYPQTHGGQRIVKNKSKSMRSSIQRVILGENSKNILGFQLPRIFSQRW